MAPLRYFAGLLRQNRYTVIFCAATLIAVVLGGFTDRRDARNLPWPIGRIPVLSAGCPLTGCECIDDCLAAVYCPSGGSRFEFIAQGAGHAIRISPTQAVFEFPGSKTAATRQVRATIEGGQLGVHG